MLFIGFGKKPKKQKIKHNFTVQNVKRLGPGGSPRRKTTLLFQQYKINIRKHSGAARQIETLFKQMEGASGSRMRELNKQFAQIFQKVLNYEGK